MFRQTIHSINIPYLDAIIFTSNKILPIINRLLITTLNDIVRLVDLLLVIIHIIEFVNVISYYFAILA